jgi:hypothetical protein
MLYREIIAICSQIHTKHINTMCRQNVELFTVTTAVLHLTCSHATTAACAPSYTNRAYCMSLHIALTGHAAVACKGQALRNKDHLLRFTKCYRWVKS